ncbi:hypothetical protein, partial [Elizabethkingia anophelis]|uniref:hypothetical protein n=1 Tax=Elizabethkingia anophelis TaxID=1117645 RepID=UPI001C88BA9C
IMDEFCAEKNEDTKNIIIKFVLIYIIFQIYKLPLKFPKGSLYYINLKKLNASPCRPISIGIVFSMENPTF